jgi:hypothetical protein
MPNMSFVSLVLKMGNYGCKACAFGGVEPINELHLDSGQDDTYDVTEILSIDKGLMARSSLIKLDSLAKNYDAI